ncbi:type I-E CRISPR-associated protein Cas6/Cse3/CasE [Streptomyces sp. NPDC003077]|uniref:type I-E CRISPR-associated protein Cas6/Cse3/CasE n=1 Tax=Streptomyces sp. NPDC003077 TaxID=3154443 RepID=UPI0033BDE04A
MTGTPVHLARLLLEERSPDVHRDLQDATRLHRTVQSLFPDALGTAPRAALNTLYRLERERTGAVLLVQSTLPINHNALRGGYTRQIDHRDLRPLLDWIRADRLIRYRIDANPMKSLFVRGRRGTRVPLSGQDALAWWDQQARKAGVANRLVQDLPQPDVRATRGTAPPIRLRAIRFEGVGAVTDSDALRTAVLTGIGRGRAFGLGLLSVAPYQE